MWMWGDAKQEQQKEDDKLRMTGKKKVFWCHEAMTLFVPMDAEDACDKACFLKNRLVGNTFFLIAETTKARERARGKKSITRHRQLAQANKQTELHTWI